MANKGLTWPNWIPFILYLLASLFFFGLAWVAFVHDDMRWAPAVIYAVCFFVLFSIGVIEDIRARSAYKRREKRRKALAEIANMCNEEGLYD